MITIRQNWVSTSYSKKIINFLLWKLWNQSLYLWIKDTLGYIPWRSHLKIVNGWRLLKWSLDRPFLLAHAVHFAMIDPVTASSLFNRLFHHEVIWMIRQHALILFFAEVFLTALEEAIEATISKNLTTLASIMEIIRVTRLFNSKYYLERTLTSG